LDFSVNEYNVFYLNTSKMPLNNYYNNIENILIQIVDEVSKNEKNSLIDNLRYFKNSVLFKSKFINNTKYKLISVICNNIMSITKKQIFNTLVEYIESNSNKVNSNECNNYFLLHGEEPEFSYDSIYKIIYDYTLKKSSDK